MKRVLVALMMVLALTGYAQAINYETLTIADTAKGITATFLPSSADYCSWFDSQTATCTLETAQVRYRVDGTAPTSAEGHLVNPGDIITLESCLEMFKFKAIRTGATSGVLKCTYQ